MGGSGTKLALRRSEVVMLKRLAPFALLLLIAGPAHAKSWIGDTTSGWVHVGGGGGIADAPVPAPVGRVSLGLGAYTIGVYAAFELDGSFRTDVPAHIAALGMVGIHIPTPVIHPMFGLRAGGGPAFVHGSVLGSAVAGGHLGLMIRQFDGQFGFRIGFDADAVIINDGGTPWAYPEVVLTGAFVF